MLYKKSTSTSFAANCVGYKFQVTPTKGTFDNARQQCFDMGGDLIHINLGPQGAQYHE